jgi:hypothetical protein
VHQGQVNEQFLGIGFRKGTFVVIPFATLEEKSVDHTSSLWSFFDVLVGDLVLYVIVKVDSVDGNVISSSEILKSSSQEGLREEESREPVFDGSTSRKPILEEIDSVVAVNNPRSKRLERQESNTSPSFGHLIVEDFSSNLLKFVSQNDFSDDSSLDLFKRRFHYFKKTVVSDTLLEDNSVHGFKILNWEVLGHSFEVENWSCLCC